MSAHLAYIHALTRTRVDQLIPVRELTLTEYRNGGWLGEVNVDLPPGVAPSVEDVFKFTISRDLRAGASMGVRLVPVTGNAVRTWPSVILALDTIEGLDPRYPGFRVRFCDPLTMMAHLSIWAVFKDTELGRIVGGAMALAGNGSGLPTYTPVLPGLPKITVTEQVHSAVSPLPLAIAAGAPLGDWLQDLMARLGARLEVTGFLNGTVHVHVTDSRPTGTPLEMTLGAPGGAGSGSGSGAGDNGDSSSGSGSATGATTRSTVTDTNAELVSIGSFPVSSGAAVLDNPTGDAKRYGGTGGVARVIEAMGLTSADELRRRSLFSGETALLESTSTLIATGNTGMRPGVRIKFTNVTMAGNRHWQAMETLHAVRSEGYRNICKMYKDGIAWRGTVREQAGDGVFVSAVVDDGESEDGAQVDRDRQGRIPVRFSFLVSADDNAGSSSGSSTGGSSLGSGTTTVVPHAGDVIHLPIIEPMGGGGHGFISAHRQGDPCRVSVRSPLYAEIVGFGYRDHKRVPTALLSATAGLLVGHGTSGWAGVVFRPMDEVENEG